MRIAMFLDTDFPPDSRVENEAISLIQDGHELFLFSLSYQPIRKHVEAINGIQVFRFAANKLLYKLSALVYTFPFFSWLINSKIKKFIYQVQPDALHIHDMPLAETVMQINKSLKLPVTLDLHEERPEIMKFYPHLQKFPGNVLISPDKWARKQAELMQQADHIILVTKEAKEKYSKLYENISEKITVVPNTVNPQIFLQYPVREEIIKRFSGKPTILYVGDTGLRRGTDTAIRSMSYVLDELPETQLVLVGDNSEDKVLNELVIELNLKHCVIFEGWKDVSLFPSYIKASSVCISPLKRNPHHDTTYANKIFQYMSMGKPLVVSDCPAQQRVIEEAKCGLIHKAEDYLDLANKLVEVLADPQKALMMGSNAVNAVERKWNWDKTKKGLLKLYNNI